MGKIRNTPEHMMSQIYNSNGFEYDLYRYECNFCSRIKADGSVVCELHMNTINDLDSDYAWIYCNLKELKLTQKEAIKKHVHNGLRDLYYELINLDFAWEGSEPQFIHGAYIALSRLIGVPVYDVDGPHILYRKHGFENWGERPKYWYKESKPRYQRLSNVSKTPTLSPAKHLIVGYEEPWRTDGTVTPDITY